MEREEDDYEDIVNEEKKAEATAGQSTCLLSFLILVTYDKDGNPVKTISKEPNVITSLQRESSYPPCKKDFYTAEESTASDALKQWILDNHISIHNLVTGSSRLPSTPSPSQDRRLPPPPVLPPHPHSGCIAPSGTSRSRHHRQQPHGQWQDALLPAAPGRPHPGSAVRPPHLSDH